MHILTRKYVCTYYIHDTQTRARAHTHTNTHTHTHTHTGNGRDSMTEYWHDSLDRQRKIRFKCRNAPATEPKKKEEKEKRRETEGGWEYVDEPSREPQHEPTPTKSAPRSPTCYTAPHHIAKASSKAAKLVLMLVVKLLNQ